MPAKPLPLLLAVVIAASLSPPTQAQGLTGSIDSNHSIDIMRRRIGAVPCRFSKWARSIGLEQDDHIISIEERGLVEVIGVTTVRVEEGTHAR